MTGARRMRRRDGGRIAVVVVALIAALLPATTVQAAPPGTPAPIRILPICQELVNADALQCPGKNDVNRVNATGALSGNGSVQVTIDPLIPPCESYDTGTLTWTPGECYSGVIFGTHGKCRFYNDRAEQLQSCIEPEFQDGTSAGSDLSGPGLIRSSKRGPDVVNTCGARSSFNIYSRGGPPGSTWPEVAPDVLNCELRIDRTPDNLLGATWHEYRGVLIVQRTGNPRITTPSATTFYIVEGTLGPNALEPIDPDPDPDPVDPFEPVGTFTDIRTSSFAREDVALLLELGITQGISPTKYGPDVNVTREQMAAFLARLWRSLGNDCDAIPAPFDDVPSTSFAYDDAACIFDLGITTGIGARRYDPNGLVTREQMAAFLARLWRALGNTCASAATGFADVPASSFAATDVACLFDLGITTGTSSTTYGPTNNVTREQMAAFLGRLHRTHTD